MATVMPGNTSVLKWQNSFLKAFVWKLKSVSMATLNNFCQLIGKEREVFWDSFFRKYEDEEDGQDVDVRSYMDNSFSRISTLLELANEDDKEPVTFKGSNSKMLQDFEEQSSKSSEAYSVEVAVSLNKEQEEPVNGNFEPAELLVVFVKKVEPIFVREIDQEEEDSKHMLSKSSHRVKKFKLFESSPQSKDNVEHTITSEKSNHLSGNIDGKLSNESAASIVSEKMDCSFQKSLIRRVKSRSKNVPSPKRLKLV